MHIPGCNNDLLNLAPEGSCIDNLRLGWTSRPNVRSSFDILWSCLSTVFLCTWTVLCLNVPADFDSYWTQVHRKAKWAFLAIFGPEFLVSFVIGHWSAAKRSVEAWKGKGFCGWTIRHAYYADMGGFVLRPPDFVPFPVNSAQILWLVEHEYISMPTLTEKEIDDKSKADTFAKWITILQTGWFLLQSVARFAEHLAFTTLELATLAFVFCSLPTYYFWMHKPLNVYTPTTLGCDTPLATILKEAGQVAREPYKQTPLDFVDDLGPSWSLTVMPHFGIPSGPKERPLPRHPNDRLPNINGLQQVVLFLITMLYSAIHTIGWNFSFATIIEKNFWRAAGLVHLLATFAFWCIDRHQVCYRLGLYRMVWNRVVHPRSFKTHASKIARSAFELSQGLEATARVSETMPQNTIKYASKDSAGEETAPSIPDDIAQASHKAVSEDQETMTTTEIRSGLDPSQRTETSLSRIESYTNYHCPVYEVVFHDHCHILLCAGAHLPSRGGFLSIQEPASSSIR